MTSTTRLGALRFDILLLAAVAAASLALPAGARGALAPPAGLAVTDVGSGNVRLVWSRSGPNAAQVPATGCTATAGSTSACAAYRCG